MKSNFLKISGVLFLDVILFLLMILDENKNFYSYYNIFMSIVIFIVFVCEMVRLYHLKNEYCTRKASQIILLVMMTIDFLIWVIM